MANRRGGDIQRANMMLRRVQENMGNPEALDLPLQALHRASKTTADYLRERNYLGKIIEVLKRHNDKPEILLLVFSILQSCLRNTETAFNATKSAWEMSKHFIVEELIEILQQYVLNQEMVRAAMNLLALIANYWCGHHSAVEEFKTHCSELGVLRVVVNGIQQHIHDEQICDAGIYMIYWFECAEDVNVQRTVCGTKLNIAIEAALNDFEGKLDRYSKDEMLKFLSIPALLSAVYQDPVMGALRRAYELHKDNNATIAHKGLEVQFAVIERQKRDRKQFKCMDCEKRLSRKERQVCTRCRASIYCSRDCQVRHWKRVHKAECKRPGL